MSKHGRHIPGLVNPWQMGLLGGVQGFLQGYGQDLQARRLAESQMNLAKAKFGAQSAIEEMKAKNNLLLKQLQLDAGQRSYTVHQVGDDGKVYDVSMRNVYNSQTGKYEPTEIGRAPSKDPMAATNALIASREKISGQHEAGENARNQARLAAKNDPSTTTAAERRNELLQKEENRRAANKAAEADVRAYSKADPDTRAQMLKDAGVDIDPSKDPAAAAKAYRAAVGSQHREAYGADNLPQPGDTSAHPDQTPDGRAIKYDAQGNAYIKGPEGKPVPYTPTAEDGGAPLALDTPESQQLAQDHPSMTGEDTGEPQADTGEEDAQDQGLIAQQQAPQQEDDEQQEPQPDDEEQEQYGGILA